MWKKKSLKWKTLQAWVDIKHPKVYTLDQHAGLLWLAGGTAPQLSISVTTVLSFEKKKELPHQNQQNYRTIISRTFSYTQIELECGKHDCLIDQLTAQY